jgi:hypothetical protein
MLATFVLEWSNASTVVAGLIRGCTPYVDQAEPIFHFFGAKVVITLHHVTDIELSKTLLRVVVKTIGIGGSKTV